MMVFARTVIKMIYQDSLNKKIINKFLQQYLPKYKIKIIVKRKQLQDNWGELYIDDHNYRPRSFTVYIDKNINNKKYVDTLLHELWHIYQFVTGTVKIKHNRTYHNNIDVTDELEEDLEFEQEAERMETELKKIFLTILVI
jgi:hypothetical protein